nr:Wadjet anti-phage system protein JetD domain-containing protein [uncultured Butyrivibrio sp.]
MNIKEKLLGYGKKTITLEDIKNIMKISLMDEQSAYEQISEMIMEEIIEPVKSSGKNGNISYPLYKKYRILIKEEGDKETIGEIKRLHPLLLRSGYLSANPMEFQRNRVVIEGLSAFLFVDKDEIFVSRKERSFEIFGQEKTLDDSMVKALLRKLQITESELRFYDTPEYCFHDYIPVRKDHMMLLICENKDIWFNIRRRMFEDGVRSLFGIAIDGVVYGEGNKVSDRTGALEEYVKFMGESDVKFLYWGDIDREGFDIFRRTKDANDRLDISLFVPGYKKMIERAKNIELEDSPSSKKQGMRFDDLINDFSDDERNFLTDIFENNKLIPQEIISYKYLSGGES